MMSLKFQYKIKVDFK